MRHDEPDVRAYAVTHPPGLVDPPQHPAWEQVVYASRGALDVTTSAATWAVGPHSAVWVPADVAHSLRIHRPASVRSLYFRSGTVPLGPEVRVLDVGGLLREVLVELARRAPVHRDAGRDGRLVGVARDLLADAPAAGLRLPSFTDERAVALARLLRDDSEGAGPLEVLARRAGGSRRTLERIFRGESGLSIGEWRRRHRMMTAMRLLAAGTPPSAVARQIGYSTASAFGAAFLAETGLTPGVYVRRVIP